MPFSRQQISEIKDIIVSTINETLTQNADLIQTIAAAVVKQVKCEIEDRMKKVEKTVSSLAKDNKTLQQKLNIMEQRQKRNNIRVFGLKEDKNTPLFENVISTLNKKCKLNLEGTDLEFAFHIKGKNEDNKPLLVGFKTYGSKRAVIENRKKLKNTGIFIADDLTPMNAALLKKAQEKYGKNKVWTFDGNIFYDSGNGKQKFVDLEDVTEQILSN